jgi:hypothetical protein
MKAPKHLLTEFADALCKKAGDVPVPSLDILGDTPEGVKERVKNYISEVNPEGANYRCAYYLLEIIRNVSKAVVAREVLVFISNILKQRMDEEKSRQDNKRFVLIFDINSECETSFLCEKFKGSLVLPEGYFVEQLEELILIYNT